MLLTVDLVTKSKSGKALRVKCGEDWYGAFLATKLDTVAPGTTIDADIETDGDYGPQITDWKPAGKPNGGTHAAQPTNGALPVWANFVSNQVAHAIQAGRIHEPSEIKLWAAAAKQAFVELL